MKLLLSIIVSLSVLAGSIGVNMLNSSCTCCEGEKVCQCSSSCSTELLEEPDIVDSCCSVEHIESEEDSASCGEGCCTNEFVKLKVPLIIVFDSHNIEVAQKYLSKDFCLPGEFSYLPGKNIIIKNIPERPPQLLRPGRDFFSAFLC